MPVFKENEYPEIRNGRIVLRRLKKEDAVSLTGIFDHPINEIKAMELIVSAKTAWEEGSEQILAVTSSYDSHVKGLIELYRDHDNTVMIGYRTAPAYRHLGYGKDAVYTLVHWLMDHTDIHTVCARIEADNEDSLAIARHNGFELEEEKDGRMLFGKRLRARIYTVLFIVVVVVAVVVSYFTYERTKVYTGTEILESVVFDVSSGARIESFAGGIMTYSKDGAQAIDSKGNLLWNRTFDMQNPMAEICGKTVAFADYGGSRIYLQTADGESSEIGTDMPIRKIAVSDNGVVAAVLEDVKVTWIYLYNSNGDTIAYFRTTMEKSGYPVNLDITPSGSIVAVSYYSLDIGDIKSSVAFYNFGDVGQNSIDNYVSGYNYKDSLVPIVKFLSNSASFALSAERLAVYEGSEKPVSVKDAFLDKEVLSVFNNNEYIGIILRNDADKEKYLLQVYSAKGNLLTQKAFDFDYSEVVFSNDQYVLYGNTDIYIGTIDGREKLSMEYELPIKLVIPTSSQTKYVIVTESSVDTVQLK